MSECVLCEHLILTPTTTTGVSSYLLVCVARMLKTTRLHNTLFLNDFIVKIVVTENI